VLLRPTTDQNDLALTHLHRELSTSQDSWRHLFFYSAPLAYAVRARLPAAVRNGRFSATEIAEDLGLPLRTLQRRLSEEALSFSELLDAYRQAEAQRLLAGAIAQWRRWRMRSVTTSKAPLIAPFAAGPANPPAVGWPSKQVEQAIQPRVGFRASVDFQRDALRLLR
jgi:AraC-like DNA-binding protein